MQKTTLLLFLALIFYSCSESNLKDYNSEINQLRKDKNKNFSNPDKSPLEKSDVKHFVGLDYFPVDSTYKVVAQLEKVKDSTVIQMATTKEGDVRNYLRFALAHFKLNEQEFSLSLYIDPEEQKELFIPFTDETNGNSTYGGGRYMDIAFEDKTVTSLKIDFNKAYNPYCVYNNNFSCPIPPQENHIPLEVKAGEKNYKTH